MPIYDAEQLEAEVENAIEELEEGIQSPDVRGRVTLGGAELLLDLLGIEYDEEDNIMWLNLGSRT